MSVRLADEVNWTPELAPMPIGYDVERIMTEQFHPYRTPRSIEYHEGCRAALLELVNRRAAACAYDYGTSEADAWRAGYDEGVRVRNAVLRGER